MSDATRAVKAEEVQIGDRIRRGDIELTVTRIDRPFFGRDNMLAFVEDSDVQWLKLPATADGEIELA